MFLVLAFVFLVKWLLGWLAFHVAGGLIHILVALAIVSFIVHLVRGRTAQPQFSAGHWASVRGGFPSYA